MPTYEYECSSCGSRFEVFQSMSEEPLKECVECGGNVKRLISGGTGIIFKGNGFYVTDNKGSTNPAAPSAKSTESKNEKTAESKPAEKEKASPKKEGSEKTAKAAKAAVNA